MCPNAAHAAIEAASAADQAASAAHEKGKCQQATSSKGGNDNGSGNRCQLRVDARPACSRTPPRSRRRDGRHHDRVVRFSPLLNDGRSRFRQVVLPERRPADRDAQFLRHLLRRLSRAAGRRLHLRPLRRSDRTQVDADRYPAADGNLDLSGRVPARLRGRRRVGRGALDRAAPAARHRRRRRMGRLRFAFDGMGPAQQRTRLPVILAAIRRSGRPVPCQSRGSRLQPDVRGCLSGVGLAYPVCAEHRAGRHRPVDPASHPGNAGVPQSGRGTKDRAGTHCRGVPQADGARS